MSVALVLMLSMMPEPEVVKLPAADGGAVQLDGRSVQCLDHAAVQESAGFNLSVPPLASHTPVCIVGEVFNAAGLENQHGGLIGVDGAVVD